MLLLGDYAPRPISSSFQLPNGRWALFTSYHLKQPIMAQLVGVILIPQGQLPGYYVRNYGGRGANVIYVGADMMGVWPPGY